MERNYKETLELARNHDIDLTKLIIADEVDYIFGEHEKYEDICDCIKEMYLDTNGITVNTLVNCLHDMVENKSVELDDVLDFGDGYSKVKEEACYYEI